MHNQIEETREAIQIYRQAFKEGKGWEEVGGFEVETAHYGLYFVGLLWNTYLGKNILNGLQDVIIKFLEVVYQDKPLSESWQAVKGHIIKHRTTLFGDEQVREHFERYLSVKKEDIHKIPVVTGRVVEEGCFRAFILALRVFQTYAFLKIGVSSPVRWWLSGIVFDTLGDTLYHEIQDVEGDYRYLNLAWLIEDLLQILPEPKSPMKVQTSFLYSQTNIPKSVDNWNISDLPISTKQELEVLRGGDWARANLTVEEQRTMLTLCHLWYVKGQKKELAEEKGKQWFSISKAEYYRAFGIKEKEYGDRKEFTRETEKALKTLFELAEKHWQVIYRFEEGKGYTVFVVKQPYYDVVLVGPMTSANDLVELPDEMEKVAKRLNRPLICIRLHPLITRQSERYRSVIADWYERLAQGKEGRRVSKYDTNLYIWLLTQSQQEITVHNRLKWAVNVLKMSEKEIKTNPGRVNKRIKTLYEDSRKAGFLISYEWGVKSSTNKVIDILHLNPESFPSLRQLKLKKK